jgi:hypothetical protein
MSFITERGLNTKTFVQIYEEIAQHWKALTGKELRDNKPEGQFAKAIAEHLSNKGFAEQDVDALWPNLEAVFYDAFVSTASDLGMDYLVKLRLTTGRRGARAATGTAWLRGRPGTEILPSDLTLKAPNGQEFKPTRALRVRPSGLAFFPIVCLQAGPAGNAAEGVLQAESLPSGVTEVSNVAISENLEIASQQDTTVTIPADESRTRYQLVAPSADILGAITVIAKNTTDQTVVRELALELYDHATEARLARLPVQRITLAPQETKEVVFSTSNLDVYGHDVIRVVPLAVGEPVVLVASSSGGDWYEDHVPTSKRLWMRLTFSAGGRTSGGSAAESTYELRRRFYDGLYLPGWGNPESIRSKLMDVPGVMFARVLVNATMAERTVDDYGVPLGYVMPPKSIAVIVYGGDPELIGRVIYDRTPVGVELVGNVQVLVPGVNGQLFPVKFFRPTLKRLHAVVSVFPMVSFPYNGVQLVKDALVEFVGGVDSQGQEHAGSPPGQTLFHSQAIQHIRERVPSIYDIELLWGYEGQGAVEDPLVVKSLWKPFIAPEDIVVVLKRLPG